MLYLSTRNETQSYTAHRALLEARAPDGGLYVPFSPEPFSREHIASFSGQKFNANVAAMMNFLFQAGVSEHDIRLCVGKNPVRIRQLSNRILAGECWHNLQGSYSRLVENLARHICPEAAVTTGSWAEVGIGACVIFGIFGELMGQELASGEKKVDISLVSGDFSMAMSAWYARAWGLPIGNIVCCCNENNTLWNLLSHGMLRTDNVSIPTCIPDADVCVPVSLERLIFACGGERAACEYVERCRSGESYYPEDTLLSKLRRGMYVSVVSTGRILDTIPNAYATHGYLMSSSSALAYGGLMDYQAKQGGGRTGLILAERSPESDAGTVAAAMNLTQQELSSQFA